MRKHFQLEHIPDLTGRVCIVTGATSGLGKACALALARKHAHVILACRTTLTGLLAAKEISSLTDNPLVEYMPLDLSSLSSVTDFIEAFLARGLPLHVLINNAGICTPFFRLSADGVESHFATNYLGHFYLTTGLLPVLEKSRVARVVCVSSGAHHLAHKGLQIEEINKEKGFEGAIAFARSKLAIILFVNELNRRLLEKGRKNVYVNAVHPGFLQSNVLKNVTVPRHLKDYVAGSYTMTNEEGALTQLYLATSREVVTKGLRGQYFIPYAKPNLPSLHAQNKLQAKQLWRWTETLLMRNIDGYSGTPI